jgi:hypothetical protein
VKFLPHVRRRPLTTAEKQRPSRLLGNVGIAEAMAAPMASASRGRRQMLGRKEAEGAFARCARSCSLPATASTRSLGCLGRHRQCFWDAQSSTGSGAFDQRCSHFTRSASAPTGPTVSKSSNCSRGSGAKKEAGFWRRASPLLTRKRGQPFPANPLFYWWSQTGSNRRPLQCHVALAGAAC